MAKTISNPAKRKARRQSLKLSANSKKRCVKRIKLKCENCSKEYYQYPGRLSRSKYCSLRCHYQGMRTGKTQKCSVCKNEYYVGSVYGKRILGKYCSKKCQSLAKKKKQGIRYWIKKIDPIFSKYIRLRDVVDGKGTCCSCGKVTGYLNSDAGHYVQRGNYSTRYDERNVNLQCRQCNRFRGGNPAGYTVYLVDKYGEGIIEELLRISRKPKKFTTQELSDMFLHYTKEVEKYLQVRDRGWYEIPDEISDEEHKKKRNSGVLTEKYKRTSLVTKGSVPMNR